MKNIINIPSLRILCATVVLSLIMVGCGKDDPENEGNHIPDVNILQNNKSVNLGTKVELTSTAIDVDEDDLTYKWSFSSKPSGSSATLTTDSTKKTSFTTDKAGKYVVKFIAKDTLNAEGKDSVTITAKDTSAITNICNSYTDIKGTYSTDKTLNGCFKVVGDINVNNDALLTIKEGSTLVFAKGTKLTISETGGLKAIGTGDKPIIFTAEQKTAGYWKGINFYYSNNVKNELAHIIIEYGGGGSNWYGNLHLDSSNDSPVRLKIRDSIFRNGLKHGFYFKASSIISEFKNITSTKNKETAGAIPAHLLDIIDSDSKFTGNNGDDYITVFGGGVYEDTTWNKLTVPVLVTRDIDINKFLTINAGSKFIFKKGTKLTVKAEGALKAVGTAKKQILFTGIQKTAGYWKGINFYYSIDTRNKLDHITIEYAGGGSNWYGSLHLDSSSDSPVRINVTNSTFRHSSKHGIWINTHSIVNNDIKTSNIFADNALSDIGRSN